MRVARLVFLLASLCLPLMASQGSNTDDDKRRSCTPISHCCRICSAGKACGNSCISRRYTCHVGRGCACNYNQIC